MKSTKNLYFWLINLIIKKKINVYYLLNYLNKNGIHASQVWRSLDSLKKFKEYKDQFLITLNLVLKR